MAKSKYETHVLPRLVEIEGWARDGLTDEQIAKNLGISIQSFYTYKEKHIEFLEFLKRGKEVVDREVENALLKSAIGYEYEEVTRELVNGEMVETKRVTKQVQPNTTAQIFWLKNRKPAEWRDKRDVEVSGEVTNKVSNLTNEQLEEEIRKLENSLGFTKDG